jgi:tRNA U34 5-methylaminomethyl-2-thiouridine-forming methyltransferase MnmC
MTSVPVRSPEDGNVYALELTVHGDPTFRHVATGEVLHGQVGPWKEALQLYVEPSGLRHAQGEWTLLDAGMGCAAQLLASVEAFEKNKNLKKLRVASFDLEKKGLEALLAHQEEFPFAKRNAGLIEKMIQVDFFVHTLDDGRQLEWKFFAGDFVEKIHDFSDWSEANPNWKADLIYYDFFSPTSHPHLWSLTLLERVYESCAPEAKIITYASATCVRAVLLAAGFYVGLGIPSGRKKNSTMGATKLDALEEPLPPKWKGTFLNSHKPYVDDLDEESQKSIEDRIRNHPQFVGFSVLF